MKHIGPIVAVAVTGAILLAIVVFSFLPAPDEAVASPETAAMPLPQAPPDPGTIQAAFAAREALIQSQIVALDQELAGREADYEARADELTSVIAQGGQQLALQKQQEDDLQLQVDDLLQVQADRVTVYETQRQQAYYQVQTTLLQLQIQLDEANAKLAEARARLGQ